MPVIQIIVWGCSDMAKERARFLDMFKVMLVVGMVLCHVIQLTGPRGKGLPFGIAQFINLITFSGFLFCFGFAVGIAYFGKTKRQVRRNFAINCSKALAAFYISGIAYETLLSSSSFNLKVLLQILVFYHLPGYSEFLASFFALDLLTWVFFNQLKALSQSKPAIVVFVLISLAATFLPYQLVQPNQLGILIGSTHVITFPVLQYFGYYIMGIYFQQHKVVLNKIFLPIAILCSALFVGYVIWVKDVPGRFPPSIFWIVGAAGFLYGYYLLARKISSVIKKDNPLYFIGENTLFFLVLSNLIIFAIRAASPIRFNLPASFLMDAVILLFCYMVIYLIRRAQKMLALHGAPYADKTRAK